MKKINLLILPVIAVALLQACSGNEADRDADSTEVLADNAAAATQLDSSTPAATDTAFANKAAISGMAEVALGKMAAAKGRRNPCVPCAAGGERWRSGGQRLS